MMVARTMLADLVSDAALRELAGEKSFARGVGYFESDAVSRLRATDREIESEVLGSDVYRVRLWIDKRALDWDCTCPVGQDGDFCKHLVATGLAWIAREHTKGASPPDNLRAIRTWLECADKAALVDLLLKQAEWDEELAAELLAQAQKSGITDTHAIKETIRKAFPRGFTDYHGMRKAHARAAPVVDLLRGLSRHDAAAAFELAGYAARLGLNTLDNADDSDGLMGDVIGEIAAVHRDAATRARVSPPALAQAVFELQMADGYGFFEFEAYADVLGKEGLAAFRALAERVWKHVPALRPGARERDATENHSQIMAIMKRLARRDGDVDALVDVLRRDLSKSWVYLEIAEALAAAERHDEALAWAEQGHKAFAHELHYPLEEFLVAEYHRRARHDDAVAIRWARFASHPSLNGYQSLKKSADRARSWKDVREKALAHVRGEKQERKDRYAASIYGGGSLLVEIFLLERDPEAALAQARSRGCPTHLWVELAKALEAKQPAEAIAIYQNQIDPIVRQTNNQAYDQAAELLRRVRDLMAASERSAEFSEYVAALRTRYKAKRNFMPRLDAVVEGPAGPGAKTRKQ